MNQPQTSTTPEDAQPSPGSTCEHTYRVDVQIPTSGAVTLEVVVQASTPQAARELALTQCESLYCQGRVRESCDEGEWNWKGRWVEGVKRLDDAAKPLATPLLPTAPSERVSEPLATVKAAVRGALSEIAFALYGPTVTLLHLRYDTEQPLNFNVERVRGHTRDGRPLPLSTQAALALLRVGEPERSPGTPSCDQHDFEREYGLEGDWSEQEYPCEDLEDFENSLCQYSSELRGLALLYWSAAWSATARESAFSRLILSGAPRAISDALSSRFLGRKRLSRDGFPALSTLNPASHYIPKEHTCPKLWPKRTLPPRKIPAPPCPPKKSCRDCSSDATTRRRRTGSCSGVTAPAS